MYAASATALLTMMHALVEPAIVPSVLEVICGSRRDQRHPRRQSTQ
jgi:hypothetical protein